MIKENEIYDAGCIRPEMAQKLLAKNGVEVSLEEAKNVLELLTFLVNLSMDQVLDQDNRLPEIDPRAYFLINSNV